MVGLHLAWDGVACAMMMTKNVSELSECAQPGTKENALQNSGRVTLGCIRTQIDSLVCKSQSQTFVLASRDGDKFLLAALHACSCPLRLIALLWETYKEEASDVRYCCVCCLASSQRTLHLPIHRRTSIVPISLSSRRKDGRIQRLPKQPLITRCVSYPLPA